MKKVKMMIVLGICLMFGMNAYAAGKQNYNAYKQPPQKQVHYNQKNVKVVKYVPVKPKPRHQPVVQKTVVVHRYEEPRYNNHAAEAAVLIGVGIIATAAIAKAIF
jgi:hypothetical protein